MDKLLEYNNYIKTIKENLDKIDKDRKNIPNLPILSQEDLLMYDVVRNILYNGNDFDRKRATEYFEMLNDSKRMYQTNKIITYQEFLNKFYPNE